MSQEILDSIYSSIFQTTDLHLIYGCVKTRLHVCIQYDIIRCVFLSVLSNNIIFEHQYSGILFICHPVRFVFSA